MTYSHAYALPSASTGLASEFGMGSGVSPSVMSPGNLIYQARGLIRSQEKSKAETPERHELSDWAKALPPLPLLFDTVDLYEKSNADMDLSDIAATFNPSTQD